MIIIAVITGIYWSFIKHSMLGTALNILRSVYEASDADVK